MSNVQTKYALCSRVCIDKYAVVVPGAFSPGIHSVNALAVHALSATKVTRCVEHCYSGCVY